MSKEVKLAEHYWTSEYDILEDKLYEVDTFVAMCEDFMHGKDGDDATKCRRLLAEVIKDLSKLHQPTVSICACGSNNYYAEVYKDVTKYYCSKCFEKIDSKHRN